MNWELLLAGPARRALKRIPAADQGRVLAVLDEMEEDPFQGAIVRLKANLRLGADGLLTGASSSTSIPLDGP